MFSLIITVIAIVLIAGLVVASLYFGGTQFTQGTAKANAARYLNEANQISAAAILYQSDHGGTSPTTLADLGDGYYLKDLPTGDWTFEDGFVTRSGLKENECLLANESLGYDYVPECGSADHLPDIPCCKILP